MDNVGYINADLLFAEDILHHDISVNQKCSQVVGTNYSYAKTKKNNALALGIFYR